MIVLDFSLFNSLQATEMYVDLDGTAVRSAPWCLLVIILFSQARRMTLTFDLAGSQRGDSEYIFRSITVYDTNG